jgi:hypothetical protein
MISVSKTSEEDFEPIVSIGRISVAEAHRESTSAENMKACINRNYNDDAMQEL